MTEYYNKRKYNPYCQIRLCGDGKPPSGGLIPTYCGVGSCNIFGCDCNGGCIPGDALESLSQLNKKDRLTILYL